MNKASRDTVGANENRLAGSLQDMVDDAETLLRSAERGGSEQFASARDRFASRVRRARSELESFQDEAAYRARRAARVADDTVHDHPYAVAGALACIGVLIGFLVTRRR